PAHHRRHRLFSGVHPGVRAHAGWAVGLHRRGGLPHLPAGVRELRLRLCLCARLGALHLHLPRHARAARVHAPEPRKGLRAMTTAARKNPYMPAIRMLGLAALIALALLTLTPFLWMVLTSLKTQQEAFQYPPTFLPHSGPQWQNYTQLFTLVPFGRYFLNTLFITVAVVFGQLVISSM